MTLCLSQQQVRIIACMYVRNDTMIFKCADMFFAEEDESSESSSSQVSNLSLQSRCFPPVRDSGCYSYILVGDNIDRAIRACHMSMEHQNQFLHFFHCYAALDRVNFQHLPNNGPIGRPADLPVSTFLPDFEDCSRLRENYAILIGRELVKKLPYFQIFAKCVPKHISHEHSQEMSMKSTVVC